ncbi:dihydroneopterin aldolase [Candidatus Bipolaricaulota bacterium]
MEGEEAQRGGKRPQVRLAVRGMEFRGRHGVHPQEQEQGHRFTVDIEVVGSLERATVSDALGDTVDYERLVALVRDINSSRRFHLIESFAGAIGDALIESFPRVTEARVRVSKLRPMLLPDVAATEAEVVRSRQ